MPHLLSRTSITIDEAVSILLGRSSGPIDFEPIDGAEDAEADNLIFDLRETLEDELEVLVGEYRRAKYEKQPALVIAEKLAALQHHEEIMEQANIHRCAIDDEINKGVHSMLRVDTALSNTISRYITLHSFNEWAEWRARMSAGAAIAATPSASSAVPPPASTKSAPRTKLRDRKDAIFAEIVGRDLNPKALPKFISGKKGLRKEIRNALQALPLFGGSGRAFDKAWEGLFHEDDGRLAYEK